MIKKIIKVVLIGGVIVVAGQFAIGWFGWFNPHLPYKSQAPYVLTADGVDYYAKTYRENNLTVVITDYYIWEKDDWKFYGRSLPFSKKAYLKLTIQERKEPNP